MSDLAEQWLAGDIRFTESQQVGVFITKLANESLNTRADNRKAVLDEVIKAIKDYVEPCCINDAIEAIEVLKK